jgi:hypothetical protein
MPLIVFSICQASTFVFRTSALSFPSEPPFERYTKEQGVVKVKVGARLVMEARELLPWTRPRRKHEL